MFFSFARTPEAGRGDPSAEQRRTATRSRSILPEVYKNMRILCVQKGIG